MIAEHSGSWLFHGTGLINASISESVSPNHGNILSVTGWNVKLILQTWPQSVHVSVVSSALIVVYSWSSPGLLPSRWQLLRLQLHLDFYIPFFCHMMIFSEMKMTLKAWWWYSQLCWGSIIVRLSQLCCKQHHLLNLEQPLVTCVMYQVST